MSDFVLRGVNEQSLLISAVRYAMGRATYMPSMTCDVIRKKSDSLEPSTAVIMARDIRNWWMEHEGPNSPEKYRTSSTFYQMDVKPFVDLLPLLDEITEPLMSEYTYLPYLPVGVYRWRDVPEEIRWREYKEIDHAS